MREPKRPSSETRRSVSRDHATPLAPTLFINPAGDSDFSRLAHKLVAHGAASPAELQRQLRSSYPRAVARARDLTGDRIAKWYVYREGHWVRATG